MSDGAAAAAEAFVRAHTAIARPKLVPEIALHLATEITPIWQATETWLARADNRLVALSLGLILGGAAGNAIDRVAHGAVVDFVLLHLTSASLRFEWYVFNLADVAIVVGVAGLLYDGLWGYRAAKAP